MSRHLKYFVFLLVLSANGLLLGGQLASRAMAEGDDYYKSLEVFSEVIHRIRQEYVEEPDSDRLMQGAINGMMRTLDPYSAYMTPKQYKSFQEETSGEYFGIGVEISEEPDGLLVIAPYPQSPAEKAGLMPGDLITKVDGASVAELGAAEAISRIKGRRGTKVMLTVKREKEKELREIPVERDQIHTVAVTSALLEPGYGYIRISQFQERVAADVQKAFKDLSKQTGGPLKGAVLDLRNNPGGLLEEAEDLSDLFVEQGVIVSIRGRGEPEVRKARRGGTLESFPLVVLINGGSASASEIVAGALQDHKRALIVGEPSYGKGSVQNIIPLNNDGALRLTIARYYTPNGRPIDPRHSIVPDVLVEVTPEEETEGVATESDGGEVPLRATQPDPAKDLQLKEAMRVLKSPPKPQATPASTPSGTSAASSTPAAATTATAAPASTPAATPAKK